MGGFEAQGLDVLDDKSQVFVCGSLREERLFVEKAERGLTSKGAEDYLAIKNAIAKAEGRA